MPLAAIRQHDSACADFARALICWLVVILLVQGQAALLSLVRGPAHRHVPVAGQVIGAEPRLVHASSREQGQGQGHVQGRAQAHEQAHEQAHVRGERHHHAADQIVLPAEGEAALDAAAILLVAALVPLAMTYAFAAHRAPMALNGAAAWAFLEGLALPPRRPPRG